MFARICLPFFARHVCQVFVAHFCSALFPAFSGQKTFHNIGPLKQSQDPELREKLYKNSGPYYYRRCNITDRFRVGTNYPNVKFNLFGKIRSECEVCQAAKQAASRSKTGGPRAETFGGMTVIDHCRVPLGTGEHIIVFVSLDGAATLLTEEAVTTTQEAGAVRMVCLTSFHN